MIIAITGVPGTGKTEICRILCQQGYECLGLSGVKGVNSCIEDDEVDLECLSRKVRNMEKNHIIFESHLSHLIKPDFAIILYREAASVEHVLRSRSYSNEKILENIDALISDVIYYEALEALPSPRIHRVFNTEGDLYKTASKVRQIIDAFLEKA
ncbi:MAG: AAA family ATPase [Thermoplasmataceae archaeon]